MHSLSNINFLKYSKVIIKIKHKEPGGLRDCRRCARYSLEEPALGHRGQARTGGRGGRRRPIGPISAVTVPLCCKLPRPSQAGGGVVPPVA